MSVSVANPSIEDLPEHVMVEILSRLPVKTIVHCRCVCNKWLGLVSDSYFAKLHLSRSPPAGLMIHHKHRILKWAGAKDELDQHDPLMSLDLNLPPTLEESTIIPVGSVNGLLCVWQFGRKDDVYICNPVTREYIILPTKRYNYLSIMEVVYCFGVGSLTKEYKVMRIRKRDIILNYTPTTTSRSAVEVCNVGTGQWTSLGDIPYHLKNGYAPFLNGHAHWVVIGDPQKKIYAFNFDEETFKLFPSPPVETTQESRIRSRTLGVLRGCLCVSDTVDYEFRIWVMKEYGIKSSWHKELVIIQQSTLCLPGPDWWMSKSLQQIDGTISIFFFQDKLLAYCPKSRTIADTGLSDPFYRGLAYCPSFLKLHNNFESERVHVY